MFSLILYCGLISFVVSKHFNIKDGSELDVNTTLSALTSTTIPVSKDCVMEMNENEILQIVELFNSNLVNVVIIHISFSNSSQSERVLSDFHLTLWTNAGGKVVFALQNIFESVVPWTLEVGIRNFALNIKGSQKECVKREKNMADFILKEAQNIVLKISSATNHKICSSFKDISTEKAFKSFCKITKLVSTIRLDSKCPDHIPLSAFDDFMTRFAFIGLMFLLGVISKFNRNPKFLRYYTLEESAPLPFFWESQVDIAFFIVRFVFISIWLYSHINLFLRLLLGQYMCSSGLKFIFFIFVCLLSSTLFYRCCYSFHTFISNTVNRLKPWVFRVKLVPSENNKYCCALIKLVQVIIFFVSQLSLFVCASALTLIFSCEMLFLMSGASSLVLGLFLNLIYFIPYFAFFSVLIFYCRTYCKTTEKKYFVLKQLIYEACQETQGINNGRIPDKHPKPYEKVIPVVSKELYEKIREQLLPYNKTDLLYFRLKMCWSFVFSYGILKFASMQNEVAVGFQAVTTASLGVIPHILNMIASKVYEERNKASHEKLKLNVKYMVEELIREDPKLAKTVIKYIDIII